MPLNCWTSAAFAMKLFLCLFVYISPELLREGSEHLIIIFTRKRPIKIQTKRTRQKLNLDLCATIVVMLIA